MTVASIDIGTNTVILLIAEVDRSNNFLTPLHNEYRMPRIGKGLRPNRKISEKKIDLLYSILNEYKAIANSYNCEIVLVTATNVYPQEAEAIVFRPQGNGTWTFVGRISPQEWVRLAAEYSDL